MIPTPALVGYDADHPLTGSRREVYSAEINDLVAEKIAAFSRVYLNFPRHSEFHGRCDYLLKLGRQKQGEPQMGMRVLAPTGSGKTTAAREFVRLVEAVHPRSSTFVPIVIIPLDRAATSKKLAVAILDYFGDPYATSGNEVALRNRAFTALRRFGTLLLIIDEVQHLNYQRNVRSDVTDSLKLILDNGVVPIVFLGTEDAEDLFTRNLQLSGRLLPPCDFAPLKRTDPRDRELFAGFVAALDQQLVATGLTARPSGLADPWIRGCLHEVTDGVIGRVSRLMAVALEISLRRSAEMIEAYDLSLAVERWAMPAFVKHNPFRREPIG